MDVDILPLRKLPSLSDRAVPDDVKDPDHPLKIVQPLLSAPPRVSNDCIPCIALVLQNTWRYLLESHTSESNSLSVVIPCTAKCCSRTLALKAIVLGPYSESDPSSSSSLPLQRCIYLHESLMNDIQQCKQLPPHQIDCWEDSISLDALATASSRSDEHVKSSSETRAQVTARHTPVWKRVVVAYLGVTHMSMTELLPEGTVKFLLRRKCVLRDGERLTLQIFQDGPIQFICTCSTYSVPERQEATSYGMVTVDTDVVLTPFPPSSSRIPQSLHPLLLENCFGNTIQPLIRTVDMLRRSIQSQSSTGALLQESYKSFAALRALPTTVALCGPNGVGKTTLLHALGMLDSSVQCLRVDVSRAHALYNGNLSQAIETIFSIARRCNPCILWLEDVDVMLGTVDDDSDDDFDNGVDSRNALGMGLNVISQLCEELSRSRQLVEREVQQHPYLKSVSMDDQSKQSCSPLITIMTVSELDDLPSPIRAQVEQHLRLCTPLARERKFIYQLHAQLRNIAGSIEPYAHAAASSHGFLGCDVERVCARVEELYHRVRRQRPGKASSHSSNDLLLQELFTRCAASHQPRQLAKWHVDIPSVTWKDIGGLQSVVAAIEESVVWPFQHAEHLRRLGIHAPVGVLLYGPPGTGKTLLAQAVATESEANFMYVNITDVVQPYVGDAERHLAEIFALAKSSSPCVIFFDEIQAMFGARARNESDFSSVPKEKKEEGEEEKGFSEEDFERSPRADDGDAGGEGGSSVSNGGDRSVVTQLMQEMDGLQGHKVIVVAATNLPWALDSAFFREGRFERSVYVPLPEKEDREQILKLLCSRSRVEGIDVETLALRTEGYSGADLHNLFRTAAYGCISRHDSTARGFTSPPVILSHDIDIALQECAPSVTSNTVRLLESWRTVSSKSL